MAITTQSYFNGQPDYLCEDREVVDRDRELAFKRAVGVLRDGASAYDIADTETGEVFTVTRRLITKEK